MSANLVWPIYRRQRTSSPSASTYADSRSDLVGMGALCTRGLGWTCGVGRNAPEIALVSSAGLLRAIDPIPRIDRNFNRHTGQLLRAGRTALRARDNVRRLLARYRHDHRLSVSAE